MNPNQIEFKRFRESLFSLLESAHSILVLTMKSDDDGIASVLAAAHAIEKHFPYKSVKMAIQAYENRRFCHLKGFDDIIFLADISPYLLSFQCIFLVDTSEHYIFKIPLEELRLRKIRLVTLDHHPHTISPGHFDLSLLEPGATSSAELIYFAFFEDEQKIDGALAEILLTGILGDTGTLKYMDAQKSYVFSVIERLVTEGNVNLGPLICLMRKCSENEFSIIQEYMRHAEIFREKGWPACTITYADSDCLKKNAYNDQEMSEAASFFLSNFGLLVGNAFWTIVFIPQRNGAVRIKIRSLPQVVNARTIGQSMNIGGTTGLATGHPWAAGGKYVSSDDTPSSPSWCAAEFKLWLKKTAYNRLTETVTRLN